LKSRGDRIGNRRSRDLSLQQFRAPVLRFPTRGPSGRFPRFTGTFKALRLPMSLPTLFRCLHSAVPRWCPSIRSHRRSDTRRPWAWTFDSRWPFRRLTTENMGSPRFLGEPFARLPSLLRPRGNLRARPLQRVTV
jgi:hypothetical protein